LISNGSYFNTILSEPNSRNILWGRLKERACDIEFDRLNEERKIIDSLQPIDLTTSTTPMQEVVSTKNASTKSKILSRLVKLTAATMSVAPPSLTSTSTIDASAASPSVIRDTWEVETKRAIEYQVKNELDKFRMEKSILDNADPLVWWKRNEPTFSLLAAVAKRVLCIPATSAPSERVFSVAGQVISQKRTRLDPHYVKYTVFLHGFFSYLDGLKEVDADAIRARFPFIEEKK